MPEWFVFMVKNENGNWTAATLHGAVIVCGSAFLPDEAPQVRWSLSSTVLAVTPNGTTTVTPMPDAW